MDDDDDDDDEDFAGRLFTGAVDEPPRACCFSL
jgi:hypothetical protein